MRTVQSWKSTARSRHLSSRPTAYTWVFMFEGKIKSYAVSCLHGCDTEDESVEQVPSKRSTERKGHAERSGLRQQRRLKRNKCPSGDTRFRTWTFCRPPIDFGGYEVARNWILGTLIRPQKCSILSTYQVDVGKNQGKMRPTVNALRFYSEILLQIKVLEFVEREKREKGV